MSASPFTRLPAWRVILSAVAVLLVAGCAATVDLAAPEQDQAARMFDPVEGKANIYVTRKDQFAGSAVLFQLIVDQKVIGGIAPGTFHLISVEPGQHTVGVMTTENQSTQELEAVAGENYFFEVKPKMGWAAARVEVVRLTESDGRAAIAESALAAGT